MIYLAVALGAAFYLLCILAMCAFLSDVSSKLTRRKIVAAILWPVTMIAVGAFALYFLIMEKMAAADRKLAGAE